MGRSRNKRRIKKKYTGKFVPRQKLLRQPNKSLENTEFKPIGNILPNENKPSITSPDFTPISTPEHLKGMQKALDFFANNPTENEIKSFVTQNKSLMKDPTIQTAVLSDVTDPAQLGVIARGMKSVDRNFDTNPIFQGRASELAQAPQTTGFTPIVTNPQTPDGGGVFVDHNGNGANGEPNVIPNKLPASQTPQYSPYSPPERQSTGFSPIVPQTNKKGLETIVDTGLPPAIQQFDVGGNTPSLSTNLPVSTTPTNQNLQFTPLPQTPANNPPTIGGVNGLTQNKPVINTPKNSEDNGFSFTRASMFGDDKNIGWLTGGAQVAQGIMDIYNGYRATKLAREQYEFKKNAYRLNYENQARMLNNNLLRQETNFAAIRNRKFNGSTKDYYKTIDKEANINYQKHKVDENAASKL